MVRHRENMSQSFPEAVRELSSEIVLGLKKEFVWNISVGVAFILALPLMGIIALSFYGIYTLFLAEGFSETAALNMLAPILFLFMAAVGYYVIDWPWETDKQ